MLVAPVRAEESIKFGYERTPMPASSRPVTESYVRHVSSEQRNVRLYHLSVPTSSPITARNCRSL